MTPPTCTQSAVSLLQAPIGQPVRITRLEAGVGLRDRLYAMGLTPGLSVEVVCDSGGPLVLKVLGSRLMLGRGMAEKVFVRVAHTN